MRLLVMALVLLAAPSAFAQGGPSFDCAKASSAVERTICKDYKGFAKADRAMAEAYAALAAKLTGPAKDNLEKEQVRWIGDRNRNCATTPAALAPCLKRRYAARTMNLLASAEGIYPFISEQSPPERQARQDHLFLRHRLSEVRGLQRRLRRRQCALRQCRRGDRRCHAAGQFGVSTASRSGPTSRAS